MAVALTRRTFTNLNPNGGLHTVLNIYIFRLQDVMAFYENLRVQYKYMKITEG